MSSQNPRVLNIPRFSYRGFDVPAIGLPDSLIDDLGTYKPAYELAPKSIPLAWRVAFYTIGGDLSLGIESANSLPDAVKEVGGLVYSASEREGGWHKDGVSILPRSDAPKGMLQPNGEGFVLARYFKDIAGFEKKNGGWEVKPSANTNESLVWLPQGMGHVVPTRDGVYNPVTGTPFETITIRDRIGALKRWVSESLTEKQAAKQMSEFYRMNEESTFAVGSWAGSTSYLLLGDVPLLISLGCEPSAYYSNIGSFPAIRMVD